MMPSLPRGCCVPVVGRLCRSLRPLDSPETSPSQSRTGATRLAMRLHELCSSLAHGVWHVRLIGMNVLKLRHVLPCSHTQALHIDEIHRRSHRRMERCSAVSAGMSCAPCLPVICCLPAHRRPKSFAGSSEQALVVQVKQGYTSSHAIATCTSPLLTVDCFTADLAS